MNYNSIALREIGGIGFEEKVNQYHDVITSLKPSTSLIDDVVKKAYLFGFTMGIEVLIKTIFSNNPSNTFISETVKINKVNDAFLSNITVLKKNDKLVFEFGYKRFSVNDSVYRPYDYINHFAVPIDVVNEKVVRKVISILLECHFNRPYYYEGNDPVIVLKEIPNNVDKNSVVGKKVTTAEMEKTLVDALIKSTSDDTEFSIVTFNKRTIYVLEKNQVNKSFIVKG